MSLNDNVHALLPDTDVDKLRDGYFIDTLSKSVMEIESANRDHGYLEIVIKTYNKDDNIADKDKLRFIVTEPSITGVKYYYIPLDLDGFNVGDKVNVCGSHNDPQMYVVFGEEGNRKLLNCDKTSLSARQFMSRYSYPDSSLGLYDPKLRKLYHLAYGKPDTPALDSSGNIITSEYAPAILRLSIYKGKGGYNAQQIIYPPSLDFSRFVPIDLNTIRRGSTFLLEGNIYLVSLYTGGGNILVTQKMADDDSGNAVTLGEIFNAQFMTVMDTYTFLLTK